MNNNILHIHNSVEHHILNLNHILYIRSNGNYSNVTLVDGYEIANVPKPLGQMARQIANLNYEEPSSFVQVGRCYIVNINHIQSIYITRKQIVFDVSDVHGNRITISPSSDSLAKLSEFISERHPSPTYYPDIANEDEYGLLSVDDVSDEDIRPL